MRELCDQAQLLAVEMYSRVFFARKVGESSISASFRVHFPVSIACQSIGLIRALLRSLDRAQAIHLRQQSGAP